MGDEEGLEDLRNRASCFLSEAQGMTSVSAE